MFEQGLLRQRFATRSAIEYRNGNPQARCREMHQSGRLEIILKIRSSPQGGIHLTALICCKAL